MDIKITDNSNEKVTVMFVTETIHVPIVVKNHTTILHFAKGKTRDIILRTMSKADADEYKNAEDHVTSLALKAYRNARDNEIARGLNFNNKRSVKTHPIFALFCAETAAAILCRYERMDDFEIDIFRLMSSRKPNVDYSGIMPNFIKMINTMYIYNSPVMIPLIDVVGKHLGLTSYKRVIYMIQQCNKDPRFKHI